MKDFLDRAQRFLESRNINAYNIALYENGETRCRKLQKANRLNNVYSISKNFTATAIGMLSYRGALDVNDPAVRYLGEFLPPRHAKQWEEITVGNLLSHTWGQGKGDFFEAERYAFRYEEGDDRLTGETFPHGNDWLKEILSGDLPLKVGGEMRYSNASYYLLSRIAEKAAGKTLFSFLTDELFVKAGFHGYAAGSCPQGHTVGATEMFFCIEDLLKLGILYLNKGVLQGVRFFAEDWAKTASFPRARSGELCYGYGFWRTQADGDFYYAYGAHAQLVVIDEKNARVFAMQGYDDWDEQAFLSEFFG